MKIKYLLLSLSCLISCRIQTQTLIPDVNFEGALVELGHDDVVDGQVLTGNISNLTSLDVSDRNIQDLTGIQDFSSLQILSIFDNKIEGALDLSSNSNLVEIMGYNNLITSLNISNLSNLEMAFFYDCQIQAINYDNSNLIKNLQLQNNQLSTVDLSQLSLLNNINVSQNLLTTLNVDSNLELAVLSASNNNIAAIDLSNNNLLRGLNLSENNLTTLDIANLNQLTGLNLTNNNISLIDVSNQVNLTTLYIAGNSISSLDLTNNPLLWEILCEHNNLSFLDLSNQTALYGANLSNNQLTEFPIGMENIINDFYLDVQNNAIGPCWEREFDFLCTNLIDGNFDGNLGLVSNQGYMDFCNDGSGECPCPHPDVGALEAFYTSTNGDDWINNTGWLENCDPCGIEADNDPWYGISCVANRVRGIRTYSNNLIGTIPPEISELTFLEVLEINNNQISSGLGELCNIPDLEWIGLANCGLNGEIPSCISELTSLRLLYLHNNNLTGLLPKFNEDNDQLNQFWAHGNNFIGSIPSSYGSVPKWTTTTSGSILTTHSNSLSGDYAPNLGVLCKNNMPNAQISDGNNFNVAWESWCTVPCAFVPDDAFERALIDLGYDTLPLDDCVPVSNIENVLTLDVSNEGIADLTGIEFFTSLENLNCSNNALISIDLSSNTALTTIDASNNMISCFNIGAENLTNLTSFYVQNNNVAGCWPEEMSGLCSLVNYSFDGNYYDGTANFISDSGWIDFCNNGDGACFGAFDGWEQVGVGANNWVFALDVFDNDNIYAGGWFTSIGGQSANYIGKWNSSTDQWDSLGSGVNNGVDALATDANGSCYVGGFFTTAGSQPADYIAKWNANLSNWETLGSGVNNGVRSIIVATSGDIYAGGLFTEAGGQPANYIAKWNVSSTSWEALGSGLSAGVRAIVEDDSGNIYAGGYSTEASGQQVNYVAKWDINLNSWEPLGLGLNSWVNSLAIDNFGNLIAAGAFTEAGGQPANHIARFNNSSNTWESLGAGFNWSTYAVIVDNNNDIVVGGGFLQGGSQSLRYIAKWDDNNSVWESLGTGVDHRVHALEFDQNGNLYVGGLFNEAGGMTVSRIARYVFCKDETIITCELPDGTYSAGDLIQSTTPVNDGAQVILNAPNIVLNPGFSVSVGSQLETQNDGCN